MKINLLKAGLIALIGMSFNTEAQSIKLTNNGSEVKELNCDMKDVKLTVNFSTSAKEYDVVDVVIKRFSSKDFKQTPLDYYFKKHMAYEYRLSKESINKGSKTFHLVNNDESDLFVGYYNYYRLSEACDYSLREFEKLYNVIYVVGGTHSGYEWKDNKKVKTYDWSTIHTMEFVHILGAVSNEIKSSNGNFSISRTITNAFDYNDYGDGEMIELDSKQSANSGGTLDLGTGQSTGRPATVYAKLMAFENQSLEAVKKNLEQQLIAQANYYYGMAIEPIFESDEIKKMVTPSLVVGSNSGESSSASGGSKLKGLGKKIGSAYNLNSGASEKNKEALKTMIENSGKYFNWESETINGVTYQTVKLNYADKQHFELDGSKNPKYKSDREKFEREYKILIAEKDGVILVLFAKQKGDADFTGQVKNDYINVFSTVKM